MKKRSIIQIIITILEKKLKEADTVETYQERLRLEEQLGIYYNKLMKQTTSQNEQPVS